MKLQGESRFSTELNGSSFVTSNTDWSNLHWCGSKGGAIAVTGSGSITIVNCQFTSIVNENDAGGAISTTVDTAIVGCSFSTCRCHTLGSALYVPEGTENLTLESSTFLDCHARLQGTVFVQIYLDPLSLTVRSCFFQGATSDYPSTTELSIVNALIVDFVFSNNTFGVPESGTCWNVIYLALMPNRTAIFENCVFKGDGARVGRFLALSHKQGSSIIYRNCTWNNIVQYLWNPSSRQTVAGVLPYGSIAGVSVEFCTFTYVRSAYPASIMDSDSATPLTVNSCVFTNCGVSTTKVNSQTSGVISLHLKTDFSIQNCTFSNSYSPSTVAISILMKDEESVGSSIHISQCKFIGHLCGNGSMINIWKRKCTESGCTDYPASCNLTILDCVFRDNTILSRNGFVNIRSSLANTVRYCGCSFINNEIQSSSASIGNGCCLLSLGGTSSCDRYVISCLFDGCSVGPGSALIGSQADFESVRLLELEGCQFRDCGLAESGLIWSGVKMSELRCKSCRIERMTASTLFQVENVKSDVTIFGCDFISCSSSMVFHGNRVIFETVHCSMRSNLSVASKLYSSFTNCDFRLEDLGCLRLAGRDTSFKNVFISTNRLRNSALMLCPGSWSLRFHNCCFTGLTGNSRYLNLSGSGTVSFSNTCFDRGLDESISTSGSVSFVYHNGQDFMFGNCECFVPYNDSSIRPTSPFVPTTLPPSPLPTRSRSPTASPSLTSLIPTATSTSTPSLSSHIPTEIPSASSIPDLDTPTPMTEDNLVPDRTSEAMPAYLWFTVAVAVGVCGVILGIVAMVMFRKLRGRCTRSHEPNKAGWDVMEALVDSNSHDECT